MLLSTVITGNHYFVDGFLGIIVASIGLWLAVQIKRYGERRELAAAEAAASTSDQAPSSS
jgi:membrane-associated phospholipid phosphatase